MGIIYLDVELVKMLEKRWRIGEKAKKGAVVKRKPSDPRKEEKSGERESEG